MKSSVQKLLSASLLSLALLAGACKEPDPYKFETHIERIRDSSKRAAGFSGLEELTKTVVTSPDNKDRLQEFAEKVIPVFAEVWDEVPEHHEKILVMLRDVGRPEGSVIWNKALALDGSVEARKRSILALEGIRKAKAADSVQTVIDEFKKLIQNPKNDGGNDEENGKVRMLMAEALGALRDKRAVDVLIDAMQQPRDKQPTNVHRAAATALGQIGDPKAVDALLTVAFRVPDAGTSKNVAVRAKQALVAIGDPAIPRVIEMLNGKHEEVQKLLAQAMAQNEGEGLNQFVVTQTAASILGAMGSPKALDALLAAYPRKDCEAPPADAKKDKKEGEEDAEADDGGLGIALTSLRAVVAQSLGLIGDPRAAEALCLCSLTSKEPDVMFAMLEALGRVGGPAAVDCLINAMKSAEFSKDAVTKEFVLKPRWDAARFAVLAASPEEIGKVEEAIAAATDPAVKKEMAQWSEGIALAKKCKAGKDCYLETLRDSNANWFAREKAAFELAKLADNDPKVAAEIAKAYKVRNPDARVTMAWLPSKMLHGGTACPECASALEAVLAAENLSTDVKFQPAVLMARDTIARFGNEGAAPAAPAAKAP
ncbi:MAG: HEAT repeat domain-containing protein [Deltaproteobacteria bacterium]|nr:HEAT repeat domain-containing protein [Deltaproteobacteria bacterium]MBK8717092.1 HEAT repeat domain-containing protein [Deltaproteobacteria bacterium]MBP7286385.1 HEAT repeat domain-containing protein [Nannocystaceae bacterium]